MTTNGAEDSKQYDIRGYDDIPVEYVFANPLNPRPTFQLPDDDPGLLQLGDSIKTMGQHRPAMVFELKGHYSHPDQVGRFMLLQGERRWRACRLANVETLSCFIVRTPKNQAEEEDWLGNEEAFKVPWGKFFQLKFAKDLAEHHGIPMVHLDMVAKTGIKMDVLRQGEKVFKLEEPIQALVAEYEETLYRQQAGAKRSDKKLGRMTGVRTGEFSVQKAALVYDIFSLLRQNMSKMVEDWDNCELQQRIAVKVAHGTSERELDQIASTIREMGEKEAPGITTAIADLLSDPQRRVKDVLRRTGTSESARLAKTLKACEKIDSETRKLTQRSEQLGNNIDVLRDAQRVLAITIRSMDQLERKVHNRIRSLEQG